MTITSAEALGAAHPIPASCLPPSVSSTASTSTAAANRLALELSDDELFSNVQPHLGNEPGSVSKLDKQAADDFRQKVALMASLRHPNVVRALAASIQDDNNLLVMERMEGTPITLRDALSDAPSWPLRLSWIKQLTDGLLALHQHGIAHRQVNSSNVLLCADGTRLKLADCGLGNTAAVARTIRSVCCLHYTASWQPPLLCAAHLGLACVCLV